MQNNKKPNGIYAFRFIRFIRYNALLSQAVNNLKIEKQSGEFISALLFDKNYLVVSYPPI